MDFNDVFSLRLTLSQSRPAVICLVPLWMSSKVGSVSCRFLSLDAEGPSHGAGSRKMPRQD